jgi:hypothetical protein
MAIFAIILIAASLFFLYALVKFHTEAVRPRPPRRHKGVIVFREIATESRSTGDADKAKRSGEAEHIQGLAQPLPFGVRRLAVKRTARG